MEQNRRGPQKILMFRYRDTEKTTARAESECTEMAEATEG
jgi:hypothetical protein